MFYAVTRKQKTNRD